MDRPQTKKGPRVYWTQVEEAALIDCAKELILQGQKAGNGFKPGFYKACAKGIREKVVGSRIEGNPHVLSKLTSWKKEYNLAFDFMSKSGVEYDSSSNMLVASIDMWDEHAQNHPDIRGLYLKPLPYYDAWCEIFGKDRATGQHAADAFDMDADALRTPIQSNGKGTEKVGSSSNRPVSLADDEDVADVSITPNPKSTGSHKRQRRSNAMSFEDDSVIFEAKKALDFLNMQLNNASATASPPAPIPVPVRILPANCPKDVIRSPQRYSGVLLKDKIKVGRKMMKDPVDVQFFVGLTEEEKITYVDMVLKDEL